SGRMGLAGEAARVADVMGRAAARLGEEAADPGEPDEAAFEAVRRKVLGDDYSTASRSRRPIAAGDRSSTPFARANGEETD
ncbi:MAG: hypothetical protein U1C74_13910, partial [Phenylobacterium sp.]|nr:hypothetical protein [Phenylobacterium sp.]